MDDYRRKWFVFLIQEKNQNGSDDLYNFHEAVSLLIETEEQVIEEHRSSMEVCYENEKPSHFLSPL